MPAWPLFLLGLIEMAMDYLIKVRQNNQQNQALTPEEEAEFDQRVNKLRTSIIADPNANE